ncbi:MAG: hypothetical protein BA863_18585 [Desulfovibrio sp. S3730MH75]|nr:MAG: hypothetical protein BA863_18585 [Desulfovibrio sp. S3730MH75]
MKKITVLFTVLLMLGASMASAAITPELPQGLVNATKYFTGFVSNATAKADSGLTGEDKAVNATMAVFNSTGGGFYSNGTQLAGDGNAFPIASLNAESLNGTYSVWNGSDAGAMSGAKTYTNSTGNSVGGTNYWNVNQMFGSIDGVLTMGNYNGTNATSYYAYTSGAAFIVGIANATADITDSSDGNGTTLIALYDNGTAGGSVWANTWDYYAYGLDTETASPAFVVGQVVLGTKGEANNAQVTMSAVEGGARVHTTTAITYNATTAGSENFIQLYREAGITLLTNGTVNADKNLITGYILDDNEDSADATDGSDKLFVVMIKSGSTFSSSDVSNRAFKLVSAGAIDAASYVGNATAGMMAFSVDANLGIDGNLARFSHKVVGGQLETASLSGYTVELANTSLFATTQSNMTIKNAAGTVVGSFLGKQSADKTMYVGIYESEEAQGTGYSLAFLIPNPAVTGAITAAGASYQKNATIAWALTGGGTTMLSANTTAYSQTALRTQWTGIPSNFTPLTDVKGFNGTIAGVQDNAEAPVITLQYGMTGIGDKVANLRLYKVLGTSAKSVRGFSYAGSATPTNVGSWWISTAVADGYLNSQSVLAPGVEYYVNYVIQDNNGSFDSNAAALAITDPVVLGSVPTSSSSSSSGCVFNPAASFGLEWLLLMLAPLVAVVRSRFKK